MLSPWSASPGLSCSQSFFSPQSHQGASVSTHFLLPQPGKLPHLWPRLATVGHVACCSTLCLPGDCPAEPGQAGGRGEWGSESELLLSASHWIPGQTGSNKKGVASSSCPNPGRLRPWIRASFRHKDGTDAVILSSKKPRTLKQ